MGCGGAGASSTPAGTRATSPPQTKTPNTATRSVAAPLLVGVRASARRGVDRIVFAFAGGLPASVQARYVRALTQDPSGRRVAISAQAILRVRFRGADAHDQRGRSTAPANLRVALRNAMRVTRAGDFEATLTYGIGLAARSSFTVRRLHGPDRIVIAIDNRYRAVRSQVFFMDVRAFHHGRGPYVKAVSRWVPAATPATGLMQRLFAGPTPAEEAQGLRLVTSQATGFSQLSTAAGVARVRLSGGCASGGSTFTIANEIAPTLEQLPNVSYVKIYDPHGATARPEGRSSSIPECLNP